MDVLSSTVASSDDEEVVVCKRKANQSASRRHRLADSDDDSPPQSPLLAPTGTLGNDSSLRFNSRTADSIEHSEADDDASTPSDRNTDIGMDDDKDVERKGKIRKRRVVRDISVSDDETEAPAFFEETYSSKKFKVGKKKVVDSESESDVDEQVKPSRFRRKDKVMEKIRNTFGKKRTENTIEPNDIMKPLLSLCDKDSSSSEDERSQALNESIHNIKHSYEKHKDVRKSKASQNIKLKVIEPQHKRMSAKEAMENMTKIKSESSRMLREKRVTLPYHRPRQLSLQDILGRKRPVLPESNHLSFKMNQEQLEQYALQLEESQKHMTELYKSDDEDDLLAEKERDNNAMSSNETEGNFKEIDQDNCGTTKNVNMQDNSDSTKEISEEQLETANTSEGPVTDVTPMEIYQEDLTVNASMMDSPATYNLNKTMDEESDSLPAITTIADSPPKFVDSVPSDHNINQDSQLIHLHFDSENTEVDKEPNTKEYSRVNNIRNSENDEDVNKNNNIVSVADVREANNSYSEIEDIAVNKVLIAATDSNVERANSHETHDIEQKTTVANKSANSNELDTSFNEDKDGTNEEMSLRINTSEFSSNDEKDKSKEIAMEMMQDDSFDDDFPDDDIDAIMDKIDNGKELQIEDSPMLIKDVKWCKPQLSGSPGTVIDLDDPTPAQKKMSGVDLLKQRYMYFSNMKTPEEEERENEKKMKPGTKHLQLKHELERQIAEQSLAEWTKRLEEDRQQQEIRANGELSDCEDELEKMEKICDDDDNVRIEEDSIAEDANENKDKEQGDELGEEEEEEELDENEERHKKKMKSNPMIDDEAEVDDDEEGDDDEDANDEDGNEDAAENDDQSGSSDEQESSSEEEDTEGRKPKKGRIIKAFEDSDDEDEQVENKTEKRSEETMEDQVIAVNILSKQTSDLFESQTTEADEDIPLAQPTHTNSEDMNASFSEEITLVQPIASKAPRISEKLTVIFETQQNSEVDMEAIVGMCSGKFPSESQPEPPVAASVARLVGDISTQLIGEDIVQLCSGRFGEDVVTTQTVNNDNVADMFNTQSSRLVGAEPSVTDIQMNRAHRLFDELDTCVPKINKYFGEHINGHGQEPHDRKVLQKGKLVIESSDEETEVRDGEKNKKKMKRKKREKRTLLISDDEEEESEGEQSASEEDGMGEEGDRIFEYDSEENEVEVKRVGAARARVAHDFLEREAELSSEEEWAGSGDEDERGPDRLEREAGDDDVFHQGRLQRELGHMHMQDLLDQDKREVRMLQEILLEDGDLEGGSRQRKFRWKNTDGGEEAGTVPDEFGDTPEDERESEEQWRRQRHERQAFLRQLAEKKKGNDDILDVGFARSIAASSLRCKTTSGVETTEEGRATEGADEKKQSNKDLPSPVKNSFTIMQEQYRALVNGVGGGGSLRRLAALVEPEEKPVHNVSSLAPGKKRSFVFTTLTQPAAEPLDDDDDPPAAQKKKRKAELDIGTPKLIKKLRVEEKHNRRSIFHHLDT